MRPITDILREIRNGRGVDLASQRLAEVVQAVDETGKKGSITITLTVDPEKGGGSQKTISMDVKAKIPEIDLPKGVFFSDTEGNLLRTDPAQTELRFRDASSRDDAAAGQA